MEPRHKHICLKCVFLGQHEESQADLYFCPTEPTLVARYSSNDWDYSSGLFVENILHNPAIGEAFRLAVEKKLLKIVMPNDRRI